MENTQLSKLLVVTKRAREPNDGWHSDTFFQGAEGVGALVPTPKKLKAVAARVVPHGGEEKTKVTFPPYSSLSCKDKCWLSSVAPSFYLQRFANLDSPSHPFHSCRPIASRRLFLGEHAPIAARFQAEDGLCHSEWRENHFIQNTAQSLKHSYYLDRRGATNNPVVTLTQAGFIYNNGVIPSDHCGHFIIVSRG